MASYPALDITFPHARGRGLAYEELLPAFVDDFQPVAIIEHETAEGWRVFFRTPESRDAALEALRADFRGELTALVPVDVPDDGWARRSQEQLKAVRVGRIIIAPPWDVPNPESRTPNPETVIVIDPSMGFGTGHHETTRLCLRLLQDTDLAGRRVIDVGTGSGVLAIAAAKLGAREVVALDHDADALVNARENIARNTLASTIDVRETDLRSVAISPGHVVVANLTGAALQQYATTLLGLTKTDGLLIVSGFSPDEAGHVAARFGTAVRKRLDEGEWTALLLAG